MLDSLMHMFRSEKSGKVAKKRLQMVLIQDRANVSPEVMAQLRDDIIQVISKYMVIDKTDMEISLENVDDSVALVANIPVQNMKHHRR
ncbi:MAG: cell division topological specificity factor MinE [Anaerovibrio sp.]|uniref:cell division topological specificity factor MinE n=1 Tax=Anaerovibrio sp. TaxID=1872532 RepID=UPI0025BEBA2D|nr:cell division topological specificity factor MinE [Anaerovibrio sp.]MBE6100066.1 cell division topological specificity factor MinE [Anaerovibrio sp.]MBQ3854420.1 cell division topological specificity factor MinE [Anaerovibrio sp.]